ncbi:LysM peptidoglycan-binding domain-containing protein [Ammoniphilus sp. CFH 90114]|uniref:LysM peptidoglycan-binding domain-containing protein n=1 Tax=Ammoniphilus sp. CFH 90114 TaxID=2493665 RepID=UPI0013E93C44|nr:LysM peptidoglycan-binding domain-containing protein [Ammoniphilus sp. CFH 90114]
MVKRMGKIALTTAIMTGWLTTVSYPTYAEIAPNMKVTSQGTQITLGFKHYQSLGAVTLHLFHLAKAGDTLWSIAKKYGLTVEELSRINKLEPTRVLLVNQRILIPVKTKAEATKTEEKSAVQVYIVVDELKKESIQLKSLDHKVKPGETLFSISKRYGVSLEAMAKHNQIILHHRISSGTTLKVPQLVEYSVKSGDTLHQIARKHNLSVDTIALHNNLKEHHSIKVGQRLKIPQ